MAIKSIPLTELERVAIDTALRIIVCEGIIATVDSDNPELSKAESERDGHYYAMDNLLLNKGLDLGKLIRKMQ